jgi:hypothetical protein
MRRFIFASGESSTRTIALAGGIVVLPSISMGADDAATAVSAWDTVESIF